MELGEGLRQRAAELSALQAQLPRRVRAIAQGATLRAVEEATEHTPPNGDEKDRGVGMITGELAQHWASDSQVDPISAGDEHQTALANNVQYASYVNDGHQMDKHFVPGLMVDPATGVLQRVDPSLGGITVGVNTTYVPGLYMKEKGVDKYKEVVEAEAEKLTREVAGE